LDILVPIVWVPTLVHELGHTLGLRHNFAGSEDKANFYSKEELAEMGVKHAVPYSSVMDYAYSELNELNTMGKYDIAALRFAYSRQVEAEGGTLVDIGNESLQNMTMKGDLKLKKFQYCTDEHVAANAGCKRMDEGTSLTEIAQHLINRDYHERYLLRNFRHRTRNFSLLDDGAYAGRINGIMASLRNSFELYERIKNDFEVPEEAPEWETIPILKDIKGAADATAQFLIDVLKTPDVMCAVAQASNPTKIIGVAPLKVFSSDAVSCFSSAVKLKEGFVVVGEGGKSFQSKRDAAIGDPNPTHIDVRGIWSDKLLAARWLMTRSLGFDTFDKYVENFTDTQAWLVPTLTTLSDIMLDQVSGPVEFRMVGGQRVTVPLQYDLAATHSIRRVLDPGLRSALNLPDGEGVFQEQLLKTIVKEMPSHFHEEVSGAVVSFFQVRKTLPQDGRTLADTNFVDVTDSLRYLALPNNVIANQMITGLKVVRNLGGLPEEKLAAILADLKALKAPADSATAQEKAAYTVGAANIEKFLKGEFKDEPYYVKLLALLPIAP
jgi:hypothetical protein